MKSSRRSLASLGRRKPRQFRAPLEGQVLLLLYTRRSEIVGDVHGRDVRSRNFFGRRPNAIAAPAHSARGEAGGAEVVLIAPKTRSAAVWSMAPVFARSREKQA
jgi:hypothetical protein